MAKKVFTDESLETLIDETKSLVSTKADSGHTHSVATQSASGFLSAEDKTQLDYGGIPIVTTAGTGAAYTATVDGMTSLKVGAKITIIPHTVSTILAPTLNVNNLGAKAIRMPVSYNTSTTSNGVLTSWLVANKPVTVQYNGSYWLTVDICRPSAQYLYGIVPVENGGTGAMNIDTAARNLMERGSWTPELKFLDDTLFQVAYTFQSGKYIKIGDMVTIAWDLQFTASNNEWLEREAYVAVGNLPYAPTNNLWCGTVGTMSIPGFTYESGGYNCHTFVSVNAISYRATSGSAVKLKPSYTGTFYFRGSLTYEIS